MKIDWSSNNLKKARKEKISVSIDKKVLADLRGVMKKAGADNLSAVMEIILIEYLSEVKSK